MPSYPNFFFIGGMRCGSTSINQMLEQHPGIYMSPVKEPYYYHVEGYRRLDAADAPDPQEIKALEAGGRFRTSEAYRSLFDGVKGQQVIGESSIYLYHGHAIPAIKADCPDARILVSLRDPVDRIFSEYQYRLRVGNETGSFADFIETHTRAFRETPGQDPISVSYLNKGLQSRLLAPWLEEFGPDRIKIVLFDDLNAAPEQTMSGVFDWLGLEEGHNPSVIHAEQGGRITRPGVVKLINSKQPVVKSIKNALPKELKSKIRSKLMSKSLERPEFRDEERAFLKSFYRDDIAALEKMIGRDLGAWA